MRTMKEDVIKVLKVKPHEHPEVYMLKNTLEAMQEAVGGYIDILGLDDNVCILLNDEGKLIGLEGNRRIGSDIIVGDFFVCGSDEEGNLISLSEKELDTYTKIFYEPQKFTKEEIEEAYEKNTGLVIIETFKDKNPVYVPGVLCTNHGPFTWGADAAEAVHNAVVLEEVAKMAYRCEHLNPEAKPAPQYLQDKHFFRKHGANAYYGQGK